RLWVLPLLGQAYMERGALEQAEALLTQAQTLATALRRRFRVMEVRRAQGLLALRQGRWREAVHALEEALSLCQSMHTPYDEAQALYLYGLLHLQQDEIQLARERLETALAILHRLGERLYAKQAERAVAALSLPPE